MGVGTFSFIVIFHVASLASAQIFLEKTLMPVINLDVKLL
jgi:hypothetical protein